MAIVSGSYGSTNEVAGLVPRYANPSKLFDTSTNPALTTVEGWIDQLSAILDGLLAEEGFTTPVTAAKPKRILDAFVNLAAAAMAEGVNGSGRFGPTQQSPGGAGRMLITLDKEAQAYIEAKAAGLERLGVPRAYDRTDGIAFRDTDNDGVATFPLFQRKAFGAVWVDYDPE